ncbi:hypothetical protein [Methylobacterium sp. WSM2598]|uniref:hypothetical protein n=1 Tax=Methylobacterium sp. WSM2598 TaxID=398261 RepID=UPI0012F6EB11|nr:hypothetical protein [Methylobacterium sp. WSM2598]
MVLRTVSVLAGFLIASNALAAELPREGNDSYTTNYVNMYSNVIKLGERTVSIYESNGVTRNDSGGPMFNDMATRCLGMREVVDGVVLNRGSCIDMDKEGDQIFTTYESKGPNGIHTFVGGTGKYTGISGTAEFNYNPLKSPENARGMVIVPHKSNWKLPVK